MIQDNAGRIIHVPTSPVDLWRLPVLVAITLAAIGGMALTIGVGSVVYAQARRNLANFCWYAVMSFSVAVFCLGAAVVLMSSDPWLHELRLRTSMFLCLPYLGSILAIYHHRSHRPWGAIDVALVGSGSLVFMLAALGPDGLGDGTPMVVKQVRVIGGFRIWWPSLEPNPWLLASVFLISGLIALRCLYLAWTVRDRDPLGSNILVCLGFGLTVTAVYHYGLIGNLWSGIPIAPLVFTLAFVMLGVEVFRGDRALLAENRKLGAEVIEADRTLRLLVRGTAEATGPEFIRSLTKHLSDVLGCKFSMVGKLVAGESVQTLSVYGQGRFHVNFCYPLAGTPCDVMVQRSPCYCEDSAQQKFPDDAMLRELGAVSYFGMPLVSSDQQPIGLLVAVHDQPLSFRADVRSTLEVFASRAAAELERISAEQRLRESELRFRTLVTHAPVGIALTDAEGHATYVNTECARIVGLPLDECLGDSWIQCIHEDDRDRVVAQWQTAIAEGRVFQSEHRFVAAQEQVGWSSVRAVPQSLTDGTIEGWLVIVVDQTEQRSARHAVQQQQSMLAHASRLSIMGEMMAGIAHELGQPLSSIANYASACQRTLANERTQFDAPLPKWLSEISVLAVRCGEIIRSMRDFVRKTDDRRTMIDLNELVHKSIALIHSDGSQRRLPIDCELPSTGPRLRVNEVQLQQVIINLLRNAGDATVEIDSPQVRVAVEANDDVARLTVEDNGPGVAPELQDRLFETFVTTRRDGLGMGLAISKSIIEAHRGVLRYVARPGGGARFQIELPFSGVARAAAE